MTPPTGLRSVHKVCKQGQSIIQATYLTDLGTAAPNQDTAATCYVSKNTVKRPLKQLQLMDADGKFLHN